MNTDEHGSGDDKHDDLWEAGVRAELKKLSREWERHMEEEAPSDDSMGSALEDSEPPNGGGGI